MIDAHHDVRVNFWKFVGCKVELNAWHVVRKRPLILSKMPDNGPRTPYKSTFGTLEREKRFKSPPKNGHAVPILNEFVTPHLESFNALFDDSGLPQGDGDGRGLLSLGIKDIGERVVFDGKGALGSESGQRGWGNRLSSTYM